MKQVTKKLRHIPLFIALCSGFLYFGSLVANAQTGIYVIEAEDFNYGSGQHVPAASTMPYLGGAYNGLGGVANVDYGTNDGTESDVYRVGESPNVDMDGTSDFNRTAWSVTVNYKIGWADTADWFNYTRNFPANNYQIYAALSHGNTGPTDLRGTLDLVTSNPSLPNQTLSPLGQFVGPGTGGWGVNARVLMTDGIGNPVAVSLGGVQTLRFTADSGDVDYFYFEPVAPPQITQQPASITVPEGGSATFTVQLAVTAGATYQWLRGGVNIPGATSSSYTLSPVTVADNNAQFRCFITNPQGSTNSNTAILTVQPDLTPPTISSVVNLGDNTAVTVLFSEPVEAASGTNRFNYAISNGVSVTAAAFGADTRSVVLTTTPMSAGIVYTLTVNNVRDRSANQNTIAPNSQRTFTIDYTPLDVNNLRPNLEPIGPSSRRTGLVISEFMYHPTNRVDGKNLEFVEIYNSQPFFEDISGHRLTGTINYTFPTNTTIPARSYLVVAPSPADIQSVYGIVGVLGGFTNNLSNGSGTIRLRNKQGAVLLEINYAGDPPWPVAADGAGHSLVLARPSFGEGDPQAWAASDVMGGTPGTGETLAANPYRTIMINEFLAHTDDPEVDYIELYNYGTQAMNVAGCILTDDPTTNKFVIPGGATIQPRSFLVYNQTNMGFSLGASGETIYLKNPGNTKIIDAVRYEAQQNGVATGRYPDGGPNFYRLINKTPGASNGKILVSDVVINEIMFNPVTGNNDDEFVELYNRTASPINLGGWRLRDGVTFTFPTNAVIPANGYVVVANNAAHLLTNYANLNTNNTFGSYGGTLANRGERIALTMPDQVISTNNGVVVTNTIHIVMNEVTYGEGGRWGKWADGGGSSLELIDPNSDNRLAGNWADSNVTTPAAWTTIELTGTLDNGADYSADSLHVGLLGIGECLLDDVEVIPAGGGNVVSNPSFESGLTGWVPQGSHNGSTIENVGFTGSRSLHIRADSRCDTAANRIRTTLTSQPPTGGTATLRAKFRWLRGSPEALLRLHGNWLEAAGRMAVPPNLGTPGLSNSRRVTNAGPAIHDVTHTPVLPAAGQAVTVTAQVHDPNGLASLVVKYRVDPGTNYNTVSMSYNGAGLYSATLPGQPSGSIVAFYIQAADNFVPSTATLFPNDAPTHECLIRYGETQPGGTLSSYHMWLTAATADAWRTRDKLNNAPLDVTFVYNNYRVIYNGGSLYSGSPFHMSNWNGPTNSLCDYVLNLPADDRFLGTTDFVLATVGNLDNDDTTQREQAAFWIANKLDVPFNYRRFINMFVNGLRRGRIFEDAQQPNSDMVDQWFPDDTDGDLHKIEDWFEFNDSATSFNNHDATLQNFTTTGGAKKLARYRWIWRKRASDTPNDYTNLFNLVDAVNAPAPEPYTSLTESLADVEEWMRIVAMEHIVGNWDSFGYNRGKNMYGYKPVHGKWRLMAWDIDFVLGSGSDGTTQNLFTGNEPAISRMFSHPPFLRAYWRAMEDAVNGPLVSANIDPLLDAKYNALVANGISVTSPNAALKSWIQSRRSYIQTQLATVAASFAITSNGGNSFTTNRNYITLTGTAPIGVKTIEINGVAYPVTWTALNTWSLNYALGPGVNSLTVQGYDLRGNPIGGSSDTITITYTGASELSENFLVINEIMYNSAAPDASFVEIYNKSTVTAFDVSNYRLDGADFAFPEGTIVQPGGFLVAVNDPFAFAATYGSSIPIAGVFNGQLDNGGETLKLVKPGATPAQDVLIDEVTYDDDPPWPTAADGFGPSLQLIDPAQDNNRVANWAASTTNAPSGPQWQYVTVTGTATSSRLYVYLNSGGDVYIDDLKLVAGSVPEIGANYIQNGDFESALTGPWTVTANCAGSAISTSVKHAGTGSLHLFCAAAGTSSGDSVWQFTTTLTTNAQYTLSYWYLPSTNGSGLTVRLSGNGIVSSHSIAPPPPGSGSLYTPGAQNSVRTNLAVFPLVWLNEIQPNNVTGPQDNFGDRDPWVELFNSGGSVVDLTGCYLSDNYTNLTRWPFPAATTLNAGQYRLVWLDNEPGETSGANLHANFRASSTNGSVVLTRVSGSVTTIVDYLNYAPINNDRSYGAFPNGTPAKRQKFYFATPGASNTNAYPATPVYINEWMAANAGAVVDPVDGGFEDWFELYNAGPTAVDLSSYTLTDDTNRIDQFTIPAGTVIPAGGYLLVWADDEIGQNGYSADLHANFKLGASGDVIGLYAPNGTNVDFVTFGQQTNDVSQGRWPDGNSGSFYYMTIFTPRAANTLGGPSSNAPPVLGAIGNKTANEGAQLSFTATATDPDSGQTLTFSLDPGAPTGAAVNPGSGVFTWTPTEAQGPGVYPVTVRVTDNGSPAKNDFETINITVNELNTAPGLAFINDQSVNEGSLLSFVASASDPDQPAQSLTFSLDPGAPAGASINATNGLFTWTPTEAQGPGTNSVTVRVTDNGSPNLSSAETFTITVTEVNTAPVLAAIGSKSVNEGNVLTFTISATDSDLPAQALVYSMDPGAPAGASFTPATRTFTWTPTEAQGPSTNTVTFRVADSGSPALADFETISIIVSEVNVAPVLTAIGNKTVTEGTLLSFTATATDSDTPTNSLTFSLDAGAPAGAAIDPTNGLFTWTPTEAQGPGTNSVTIRVTDSGTPNLNDFETITIAVNETNAAPVLAAIGNKTVNEAILLTFTISATDGDLPAQTLTYSMDPGAPNGASFNPATRTFSWTPTEAQGPGTNTVTFRVTDNGAPNLNDSETITIVVNEVNVAPVLAAIANQNVTAGSQLTITNSATDADVPANTLTYSLDPGAPTGAAINPTNGVFTWTPSTNQAPSTNVVTVRVTDNGSPILSDAKTFTIVVDSIAQFRLTSITVAVNGIVTLNWTSQAGRTYHVEYNDDLSSTNWNALGDQTASGSTMSATNNPGGTPQRFYRVLQVN